MPDDKPVSSVDVSTDPMGNGDYVVVHRGGPNKVERCPWPLIKTSESAGNGRIELRNRSGFYGDDAHDDTSVVAAAIEDVPEGGKLIAPATAIMNVNSAESEIFSREHPITIEGEGQQGSYFKFNAAVGATTDLFRCKPANAGSAVGWAFKNFGVIGGSATRGRHAFHFDTDDTGLAFDSVLMEQIYCEYLAGYLVHCTKGAGYSVFNSTFRNGKSYAGLNFTGAGDSIRVLDFGITGPGEGIIVDLQAGAGNFVIKEANITTAKGMVIVRATEGITIESCEFEQNVVNTSDNNALIDIQGTTSVVTNAQIIGMTLRVLASMGNPHPIRLDHSANAYINGGRSSCITPAYHVHDTANATDTVVDVGFNMVGTGGGVHGTGARTVHLYTEGGAYKCRGGSGTVTTLAAA